MTCLMTLLIFFVCSDVTLEKSTDPFTKKTTIRGVTPSISIAPYENNEPNVSPTGETGLLLKRIYPDFNLNIYRNNDDVFLVIDQTMRYKGYHGEVFRPKLGPNSKLQLLFDDDQVISLRYTGEVIKATDSNEISQNRFAPGTNYNNDRRWISIDGKFRLEKNDIQILKNKKLKLLRVEFENSTTDRQFDQENEDYLAKYLHCLEL